MSTISETLCHYIFNKNAEEIFTDLIPEKEKLKDFVDKCLEIALRVNKHIFMKDNTLPLYSVNAFNEGCHMYCYRVLKLKRTTTLNSVNSSLERTDDNRFLLLSFFLSTVLLANKADGFKKVFFEAMKELGLDAPKGYPKKLFKAFIADKDKIREDAARKSYHTVFQKYMQTLCAEEKGDVYQELNSIAHEDLRIPAKSLFYKEQRFYTYPTFAALVFLNEKAKEMDIPLVFKARVITSDGILGTLQHQIGVLDRKAPALIFEGIITENIDMKTFRTEAQKCAHYYRRKTKKHHSEDNPCVFCKPAPEDKAALMTVFKKNFEKAMGVENLLHVIGAEGGAQQKSFETFFNGKYEKLTEIFKNAQPLIKKFGLSEEEPKGFSAFRVYVDTLENAEKRDRPFFEIPPKHFIDQTFFPKAEKKEVSEDVLKEIGTLIGHSAEKLARMVHEQGERRSILKFLELAKAGDKATCILAEATCAQPLQSAIDVFLRKDKKAFFRATTNKARKARTLSSNPGAFASSKIEF